MKYGCRLDDLDVGDKCLVTRNGRHIGVVEKKTKTQMTISGIRFTNGGREVGGLCARAYPFNSQEQYHKHLRLKFYRDLNSLISKSNWQSDERLMNSIAAVVDPEKYNELKQKYFADLEVKK